MSVHPHLRQFDQRIPLVVVWGDGCISTKLCALLDDACFLQWSMDVRLRKTCTRDFCRLCLPTSDELGLQGKKIANLSPEG